MANISFHSNSSMVATGGPTKLLSNHFHHLFTNDSSSTVSSQSQQQLPSVPSPTPLESYQTTSNSTTSSSLPSATATIVASSNGKIIVPTGSVVRTINISDARSDFLIFNILIF